MKRYEVNIEFDSELEEHDIEESVSDFLNDCEASDDSDFYIDVLEDYPEFEDIDD